MRNLTDSLLAEAPPVGGLRNLTDNLPIENDAPATGSAFSQGLRSGLTSAGGELHAIAGQVGEGIGAPDFAADQRAKSVAAQEQAARESAGMIKSYKDVHGLRDAFDYGTGELGSALPTIGAGAVGGLAAGLAAPEVGGAALLGSAAGMLPSTVGAQLQNQQANPEQAKRSFADRTLTALGAGGAQALAMSAIPGAMEGKLIGKVAEGATAKTLGEAALHNIPGAVAGNAAAMGASAEIGHQASSHLDPTRDTSNDLQEDKDAAVEGGLFGAVASPLGIAGDMRGAETPTAPGADALSKVKNLFAGKTDEQKMAAGEEQVAPMDLAGKTPEQAGQMLEDSDQTSLQKATQWAQDLFKQHLSPEQIGSLTNAASDLTDKANQAVVAGIKIAKDAGSQIKTKVEDLSASLGMVESDTARSEDNSGIRQQITATIAPMLKDTHPELFDSRSAGLNLSDSLAKIVDKARSEGTVPDVVMGKLQNILGDQTRPVLEAVHSRLMDTTDTQSTDNFYKVMNKLADSELAQGSLRDKVRSALAPDIQKTVSDGELNQAVSALQDFVGEKSTGNMTPAQADYHKAQIREALQEHFGDKTDSLLDAFAEDAKKTSQASTIDDRAPMAEAENGSVDAAAQYEQPQYFGKKPYPKLEGDASSQYERELATARRQNPDRNIGFTAAKDLPADHPHYDPASDHGFVAAEGMKQEGRITPDELNSMKLDTTKTSHLTNASRIDTGVAGVTLDAKRVASTMNKKLEYNGSDDKSSQHRLARSFMEGIAAAQDHLGKTFDVPDKTVVASRGGKDVTYGELKKLSMRPEDPTWMKGKTDEEINATMQTKENLADSSLAELRKYEPKLQDILAAREGKAQEKINELRRSGTKLTKDDIKQIYKDFKVSEAQDAAFHLERELQTRDKGTAGENVADGVRHGSEVAPESNIHDAVAGLGEKAVARKTGFDGAPLKYEGAKSDGRNMIDAKLSQLERGSTAIQRKLAEKGRALEEKLDQMKPADQVALARVMKTGSTADVAEAINRMSDKYKNIGEATFVDRVTAGGDSLKEVIKNVASSTDAKGLQAAVTKLLGAKGNEHTTAAIDAINARLGELVSKEPQVAYSLLTHSGQKTGAAHISGADMKAVGDHIEKVLGATVKTEFAKMLHAGEFERVNGKDIIRVSVHSLDPMGVAYHESLHALVQQLRDSGDHSALKALYRAADSISVRKQLRDLLAKEPEALKQLESPEERVAYMYQFHQAGKLTVGGEATGVIGKIAGFFRKVMGTWTNDQRALHIMDYFNSGEYAKHIGDRSAVSRVLNEGTGKLSPTMKTALAKLKSVSDAVASTGDARMRDTTNPALVKIADLVHRKVTGEGSDTGFIPAAREARTKFMNNLAEGLRGINAEHLQAGMESLQSGKLAATPEARLAAKIVRKTLDDAYNYMKAAGVQLGDLGVGKDYYPRVWDSGYLAGHQAEFKAMIQKYVDSGEFKGSVQQVISRLSRNEGSEVGIETNRPGMAHVKERKLDFISAEDAAPFMQKDLYSTMNSYITQGTRRAEWARRFGDDGTGLNKLFEEAKSKHGATDAEITMADKYIKGVDGTLGDDINPAMRKAFGNMIVYQNIRLLPLAIFSSSIDAGGILVRGGTIGDAASTFKRGIVEMSKNFKKDGGDKNKDNATRLAEDLGVIDNAVLMHTLGSSYSAGMTGDIGKKINDAFFRFNMMEQFNTSMRVGATVAATKFLAKHAAGDYNTHSTRYLAELGLRPGEVIVKNGEPLLRQHEFESIGQSPEQAAASANKMAAAVNSWVDGAVLRPNAAHKPIYFNDPHFALIAHLKQFTFAFQEVIMKRALNEARHGNYTPAVTLASYVPMMVAADMVKGLIQGGGSQPDWKEGWGPEDYLANGIQRAGLLGVGQFGADIAKNIHQGGMGVGALAGPTVEQLGDAIHVVGGHGQFAPFALKSMPANALYAHTLGSSAPDPNFAD